MALGASAPGLAQLTTSGLLTFFAVRPVDPLDGPLDEDPRFRGCALPLLQVSRPPLVAAAIPGAVVALWHLPLVLFSGLSLIGLPTTFAITSSACGFNCTCGNVLLTLLFHNGQGTSSTSSFGLNGAGAARLELIYFVVVLAALVVLALSQGRPC